MTKDFDYVITYLALPSSEKSYIFGGSLAWCDWYVVTGRPLVDRLVFFIKEQNKMQWLGRRLAW